MKWVKKIPEPAKAGDRRMTRKFLFLPRRFTVGNEIHVYWLQFSDVIEELKKVEYSRGDHVNELYEEFHMYVWSEIGIKEA